MAGIEKKTSFLKALREMRRMITDGALPPGERVSEVALAGRIGVSRTPLREAMARLVEEGLLERLPAGGCKVAVFSRADVIDAIVLRGVMEGAAARLAAERGADAADLKACRDVVAKIDGALGASEAETDFDRYTELNAEFHDRLIALCRSDVVMREARRISALPLAGPSAFLSGQSAQPETLRSLFVAQDHHRTILDAIEAREGARAEAIAREHARLAQRNLDFLLYEDHALADRVPGMSLVREPTAARTSRAGTVLN